MPNSTTYIAHHGVKGQKWGVRRYQNPDGTLTMEGKLRYTIHTDSDGNTTHSITKTTDTYAKPKSKDNPYSARRTVKIHNARENLAEAARAKVAADSSGDEKRQRRMQRRLNSETDRYMRATKDPARSDLYNYTNLAGAIGGVVGIGIATMTPGYKKRMNAFVDRHKEIQYNALLDARVEMTQGREVVDQMMASYADGAMSKRPDRY
jgi:hypothetical protein